MCRTIFVDISVVSEYHKYRVLSKKFIQKIGSYKISNYQNTSGGKTKYVINCK